MTNNIFYFWRSRKWQSPFAFAATILCLGMLQGCAHTEKPIDLSSRVKTLLAAYPAGRIDSIEEADEVQDAVDYENQMLDYQYGKDMDECTKKFLVTLCYEKTDLRLRRDRAVLKSLSVEADRFKRTEKVRLRDEALVDAEQRELAKAPEREASRKKYEEKEQRYLMDKTADEIEAAKVQRDAARKKYDEKQTHYVDIKAADEASPPKLEEGAYTRGTPSQLKNPDTVLTPEKRAQNIQDYEAKKRESERKQEEVAKKMAETQAKREKRAEKNEQEVTKKQKVLKD